MTYLEVREELCGLTQGQKDALLVGFWVWDEEAFSQMLDAAKAAKAA